MVRCNVLITLCHGGRARTGEGGREKGRVCLVAALLEAEEGLAVQLAILARALLVDQAAECIVLQQNAPVSTCACLQPAVPRPHKDRSENCATQLQDAMGAAARQTVMQGLTWTHHLLPHQRHSNMMPA